MWNIIKCNNCSNIYKPQSSYVKNCPKCGRNDNIEFIYDPKFNENSKERYEWEINLIKLLKNKIPKNFYENKQPFFPRTTFYRISKNKDESLILMADGIFNFLKISRDDASIIFSSKLNNIPGLYSTINGKEIILVNQKYKNNSLITGAILAHEITHLFLIGRNKIYLKNDYENEIFTDLASIYLGLGILVINGMKYESNWFLTAIGLLAGGFYLDTKTLSFGYFSPKQYGERFETYCFVNNINLNNIALYIQPKARHFIKLPLLAGFKKTSIFYKQFLIKLLLNSFGIILIIIIIYALLCYNFQGGFQEKPKDTIINTENLNLKGEANILKEKIDQQEIDLNTYQKLINGYEKNGDQESYNSLVDKYNSTLEDYKVNILLYNLKVNRYNAKNLLKNIK